MRSVVVLQPGQVALVDIPIPQPGPYQARVLVEAAYLCNATDRKLVDGHFPGVTEYPLLLGHETVGIVDVVGEKVRSFRPGERVIGGLLLVPTDPAYHSGWGGFSEYVLAGDHAAMVADGVADTEHGWAEVYEIMRAVPADIPLEAAGLLCTWREVYGAFCDFHLQAGDDIMIFGAGPVGLSFVKFARLLGLGYIAVVDVLPEKRARALQMGADEAFAPEDAGLLVLRNRRSKGFDALIDAVGRESIINQALPLVRLGGSVCVYGVIDAPTVQLRKSEGPYNFNLLVHQWPTRRYEAAAQEPLCEWIRQGKLKYEDFLSAEYPVECIQQALESSRTGQTIKTLLRF
jgi:threonine dehydrogenase-like Zn-dependent dehydrogenase